LKYLVSAVDGCIHAYFTIEIPATSVKSIAGENFRGGIEEIPAFMQSTMGMSLIWPLCFNMTLITVLFCVAFVAAFLMKEIGPAACD
jgi:hypothetical protein